MSWQIFFIHETLHLAQNSRYLKTTHYNVWILVCFLVMKGLLIFTLIWLRLKFSRFMQVFHWSISWTVTNSNIETIWEFFSCLILGLWLSGFSIFYLFTTLLCLMYQYLFGAIEGFTVFILMYFEMPFLSIIYLLKKPYLIFMWKNVYFLRNC